MKKTLLIAVAALFVAIGANAQAKKMIGAQKPVCVAEQLNVQAKQMKADFKLPQAMRADMKINTRRAAADLSGTYILDYKNWDRDFTASSTFTIQAESGTIELDQYEKDEATGKYPTFDYNVKLIDFTYAGAVAYGLYDEEAGQIAIPVQTIVAEKGNYGRIVFSALVLDKDDAPLAYGYSMVLNVYADGTIEIDEGDFTEEAAEEPAFEGAYIGGFYNILPDYEAQPNAAWNYGFEAETFTPNAIMSCDVSGYLRTDGETQGWQDERASYPIYVENFDTELLVHNFINMAPVSVTVNGDGTCALPMGQEVDDYDYSGEDGDYGRMRLVGVYLDGNQIGSDYDKTSVDGTIFDVERGTIIDFFDLNSEGKVVQDETHVPYVRIATGHDSQGLAYGMGFLFAIRFEIPNVETGIKTVTDVKANGNSKTYNLMGQEVNAAAKGLVIKNGKKMIVK